MTPPAPPQHQPPTRPIDVPVQLAPAVERMIAEFGRGGGVVSQPLEYGGYDLPPARRPLVHVPLLVGLSLLAGVFTFLMTSIVPRFEDIFKDFGTKLPTPTQCLLTVSRFVANEYGWVHVWALALVIPVAVARLGPAPRRDRRVRWRASIVVTLLLIGVTLCLTYTLLQLPLITLIETVSAGPRKR